MAQLDRVAISRALAKALAYHECGKTADAQAWAVTLVQLLQQQEILRDTLQG